MVVFFLTLTILLCAAFWAANTSGPGLAQKLGPVSFLPGLMPGTVPGPEWALGVSSLSETGSGQREREKPL